MVRGVHFSIHAFSCLTFQYTLQNLIYIHITNVKHTFETLKIKFSVISQKAQQRCCGGEWRWLLPFGFAMHFRKASERPRIQVPPLRDGKIKLRLLIKTETLLGRAMRSSNRNKSTKKVQAMRSLRSNVWSSYWNLFTHSLRLRGPLLGFKMFTWRIRRHQGHTGQE